MALVEFDADELAKLQSEHAQYKSAAIVVNALSNDKSTRGDLLRLIKRKSPETSIPEIDALDAGVSQLDPVKKELADLKAEIKKEKDDARKAAREAEAGDYAAKGERYLRNAGYNDDGVKAVTDFMTKRGLVDVEAAEALFAKTQIQEEPIIPSNYGKNWDLFAPSDKDDPLTEILKLPKAAAERRVRSWSEQEARKTLTDYRNGRAA